MADMINTQPGINDFVGFELQQEVARATNVNADQAPGTKGVISSGTSTGDYSGFEFVAAKTDTRPGIESDFSGFVLEGTEQVSPGVSTENENLAVSSVFDSLIEVEGAEGDTTGAAKTGKLGVTDIARRAVGDKDLPDEDIAKEYLGILDSKFRALDGYDKAPLAVKEVLLDAGYNIGESILDYSGLKKALASGDYERVGYELLDTATTGGKASRGIARRRALSYNKLVPTDKKIDSIVQEEDGTLIYLSGNDEVFKYRPSKGRHRTSAVGTLTV